jgi:hypothetical protein
MWSPNTSATDKTSTGNDMSDDFLVPEWQHKLRLYAGKGSKASRRRTIGRINIFMRFCHCRHPEQIGRRQVYAFWESRQWRPTTARDYYRAIQLLWKLLGRTGTPPAPRPAVPPVTSTVDE